MTRKFILHVGTEKTGSTSIQGLLAENRAILAQENCLFPASFGDRAQVDITGCCFDCGPSVPILMLLGISNEEALAAHRVRVLSALQNELDQGDYSQVIISDEHISGYLHTSAQRARLGRLLANFGEVSKIIIYFRRQDRFVASLVGESVKAKSFHAFNYREPTRTFATLQYQYNYPLILKGLEEAFPHAELIVRGYSEAPDFDVIDDFCQLLPVLQNVMRRGGTRQNRALPGRTIEPLAKLGSLATLRGAALVLEQWDAIVLAACETFAGPPIALDPAAAQAFLARFSLTNASLVERFPSLAPVFSLQNGLSPAPTVPVRFDEFCRGLAEHLDPELFQALEALTAGIDGDTDYDSFFSTETIETWRHVSAASRRLAPAEWRERPV